MPDWQYTYPGEAKPEVDVETGYHMNLPDGGPGRANEDHYTAYIEDDFGHKRHIYIHDIQMNFQLAGATAQSPQFRSFYPRNFVQPTITVQGQCASQRDYGSLVEFIHKCQRQALEGVHLDTTLVIPAGGPGKASHNYGGHHLNGHVKRIERKAERWVNAPEFQFEFIVTTATSGLYQIDTGDASGTTDAIAQYMRPNFNAQVRNRTNKPAFAVDPDPGLGPIEDIFAPPEPAKEASTGGGDQSQQAGAEAGSPTSKGTSVGAQHETAGLPGYPARDYFADGNTPCVAPVDGKIARFSGKSPDEGGPAGGPLGYSIYLDGKNGKSYFMTHLGSRTCQVGDNVKQGDKIGTVADGPPSWSIPHIHMGIRG